MAVRRLATGRPAAGVLAVGFLTIVAIVVFRQAIFDRWTFPWDFLGSYTTTPAFVAASIGRGHPLWWSPFVASGFPVGLDPQAGIYFPGWWLLGVLRVPLTLRALTAVQIAHVVFGSVGVMALARARRLQWPWAMLAALAYIFFGGFYGEAEHADIFRGFAYVPWVLWALTPPTDRSRWTRVVALPALAWLIASGAYPGQVVSFGVAGAIYVAVALRMEPGSWRRYRGALLLATVSAAAICAAVLLPYLLAEQAGQFHRAYEPTAAVRAGESLAVKDVLGLYLNNFAWTYDGTVTAWALAVPMLIGLACVRRRMLSRHLPLVVTGALALTLSMAPKIGVIGHVMVSMRPLFPSRFPAADYKAIVAVSLLVLSADAWSELVRRREGLWLRAAALTGLVALGAIFAPSTYASPTKALWLVILLAAMSWALTVVRVNAKALAAILTALVIVDGVREAYDYRFLNHMSPWRASPAEAAQYRARDVYVRRLATSLRVAVASRPARVPPYAPLASAPTGSDPDASGWLASGYYAIDYGGTIERALWRAEHDPTWLAMLLAPWRAYVFPCAKVGCEDGAVRLPPPAKWPASAAVRTLSYGPRGITYSVATSRPVLMVENELAFEGWRSNNARAHLIDAGVPFRAWRLAAGSYRFTATYRQPGRIAQFFAALVALLAWLGCLFAVRWRSLRAPGRKTIVADRQLVGSAES
jgi:hypothetical protein